MVVTWVFTQVGDEIRSALLWSLSHDQELSVFAVVSRDSFPILVPVGFIALIVWWLWLDFIHEGPPEQESIRLSVASIVWCAANLYVLTAAYMIGYQLERHWWLLPTLLVGLSDLVVMPAFVLAGAVSVFRGRMTWSRYLGVVVLANVIIIVTVAVLGVLGRQGPAS